MADGYLCVSPYSPGLFRMHPIALINASGHAEHVINNFDALAPTGRITAGSTWYFQFWFRDHAAGGTGTNLSDAVQVNFCP